MLHLIRSKPDDQTMALIDATVCKEKDRVIRLYDGRQDWDQIVESIFNYKKVICWW